MHDTSLLTTIAISFTLALVFGIIAKRCGLSPIVGYLLAGIAASPHTPGMVGDADMANQLAEIGVILLMFGVGLHFHLKDLLAVRAIAIPGAVVQSACATVFCMVLAHFLGLPWSHGLVLGIATSVASTVVLMRVLMDNKVMETPAGHVAVGWLVVEDLFTVLVLVLLPAFAGPAPEHTNATDLHAVGAAASTVATLAANVTAATPAVEGPGVLMATAIALGKLAMLGAIMALAGTRLVPWILLRVARLRSRELFTLAVLVMSIAVATAAYFAFGASMALGAFLAGMLVGQSKFSHQAGAEILPLRDAFAVLFFVSVGMLFDFHQVVAEPWLLLGVLGVVLLVKPVAAFIIVLVLRYPVRTALTVAGGLAQIGEFSFILADVAKPHLLLNDQGQAVLVAAAIISISLNPYLFRMILKLEPVIFRHPHLAAWLSRRSEVRGARLNVGFAPPKKEGKQAIVVGYGPVGQTMTQLLREFGIEPLIVEMSIDTVAELHNHDHPALYGDATRPDILESAGIKDADFLIITLPDAVARLAIVTSARELNPQITILTRARYLRENPHLREAGVTNICFDEVETAAGLAETLLLKMGISRERIDKEVPQIRAEWGAIVELMGEQEDLRAKE